MKSETVKTKMPKALQKQILSLCGAPYLSLPTLALFLGSLGLWAGVIVLYRQGELPLWLGSSLTVVFAYMIYTCLHEAVHNSVSQIKWVNKWVGLVSAMALIAPFEGFRFVHLEHHRYTNDPARDPDIYSTGSFLPLRWLTQNLYYFGIYWSRRRKLPWKHRIEIVVQEALNLSLLVYLWNLGYGKEVFFFWIIPAQGSVFFLSLFFNYLPHHPHDLENQRDPYQATNVRTAKILTPLFLYQNFHLIHHLYSHAPFYNYIKIWTLGKDYFQMRGSVVKDRVFEF